MSFLINHPILFSIFYSLLIIVVFYTHKPITNIIQQQKKTQKPPISQTTFRVVSFFSFSLLSIFLCKTNGLMDDIYLWHENFLSINCMISSIMLFLGPIFQNIFYEYNYLVIRKKKREGLQLLSYLKNQFTLLFNFFTFKQIILGPFCEEVIYRMFTCSLWMKSGISLGKTVWFSPFIFGISHFHHYFEDPQRSIIRPLFQVGYTTIFGWWVAYIWCRTHNFLVIWFIHGFCNFMEFPDFKSALNWGNYAQKVILQVTYVFGIIYFSGIVGMMLTTPNAEN